MCGRYCLTTPPDAMRTLFGFDNLPNLPPRYNVAPTQPVAAVRRAAGGGRELVLLRWGLIPHWSRDAAMAARMINARAETVADKPAFRDSFRARRCLVPADGFYEWRIEDGRKQPFRIGMKGGAPFAFAGLWDRWTAPADGPGFAAGEAVETVAIITTAANDRLRPIHERMPVILPPAAFDRWLAADGAPAAARALLRPCPPEPMAFYRVGPAVNNVRNDDPRCLERLRPAAAE